MKKKALWILCALAIITSYGIFAQSGGIPAMDQPETVNLDMNVGIDDVDKDGNPCPYFGQKQPFKTKGEGDFRADVKDGEDATIHYIEDNSYKASENSLAYKPEGEEVVDGKLADGDPGIDWGVQTEDGEDVVDAAEPTGAASTQCNFTDSGTYSVHNCGSRLLSSGEGVDGKDTTGIGNSGGGAEGGSQTGTTGGTEGGGEAGGKKEEKTPALAMGTIPVKIHDVTPPDVWVAFQENDLDVDALKSEMQEKMIKKSGMPLKTTDDNNEELFSKTSFIFIDEGRVYPKLEGRPELPQIPKNWFALSADEQKAYQEKRNNFQKELEEFKEKEKAYMEQVYKDTEVDGRRNMSYPNKTVRVSLAGNIFNEDGRNIEEHTIVHTVEENYENLNRKADCNFKDEVKRKESNKETDEIANEKLVKKSYAVYARRNVPLLPIVMYCDNGNRRKSVGLISSDGKILEKNEEGNEPEEGKSVIGEDSESTYAIMSVDRKTKKVETVPQQEDGSYLFRIANYPEKEYEDQPDYFFEAKVMDKAKNVTTVKIPINVINTQAYDETNATR